MQMFQKLGRFLNNMDAKAITSVAVMAGLLAIVAVMMILKGTGQLDSIRETVDHLMLAIKDSPFSLLVVIAIFCGLALTGFPQTFLFAATAVAFGSTQGAIYSWTATLCSASLTFAIGYFLGEQYVTRLSAGRAKSMIALVQKRGLLAAMIIRWIPSAPFIVINSIFGVAGVPWWKFIIGTGIGIIPKIVLVSFFTGQLDELLGFFTSGDPRDLIGIALVVIVWLAFLVFVRWLYMRLKKTTLAGLDEE